MRSALPSLLLYCATLPAHAADPAPAAPLAPAAQPTTLDTVEVTAGRLSAQDERQYASAAKIVVERAELERLDAATVGEMLRQLPGVNLAPESTGPHGRQRAADRLEPNIIVDGVPLPGGNRMALRLPVELIEKVEILKTSTPEFPSGPGGTINLVLRDAPAKKVGNYRAGVSYDGYGFGGRAGGTWGDREGETGFIFMGFADTRPISGGRSVSRESFAGGARTDWRLESDRDRGRDSGLHLIGRYTRDLGDGARLVISPFLFGRTSSRTTDTRRSVYLDPLAGTGLTSDGSAHETEDDQTRAGRVSFDYKQRLAGRGERSAVLTLQSQSETSDRLRDDQPAVGAPSRLASHETSSSHSFTFRGKQMQPLADSHLGTLGLDAVYKTSADSRRDQLNGAPVALGAQASADATEQALAVWAQDEWQLTDTHLLTPGLRVSASSRATTDASGLRVADDRVSWLPSLHYLWQFDSQWNFRASLARSEKLPGVSDLSPVVRTTTGQNSLANPDRGGTPGLRPETTDTLQVGLEHFLSEQRGSAGLNLYLRELSNPIQRRVQLEAGRYVDRPVNFAAGRETSVVADFKWKPDPLPGLSLRGNVSTSQLTLDDPAALVRQQSPRRAASAGFDYDWKARQISFGATVSASSRFTREANPSTEQTQIARTQIDFYAARKINRKLSLRLSVDNLALSRSGDDNLVYSGGALSQREFDRNLGLRVVTLSLEGKF